MVLSHPLNPHPILSLKRPNSISLRFVGYSFGMANGHCHYKVTYFYGLCVMPTHHLALVRAAVLTI